MQNITIKDVAKKAGVSCAQVSRALNGKYGVSTKTMDRIISIADSMGYMPNSLARSLVKKEYLTIALFIPDITNPFFAEIAQAVIVSANEKGFQTILCNTFWDEEIQKKQIKSMLENRVAGIIIKPVSDDFSDILSIDLPCVFFNAYLDNLNNFVEVDNKHGEFMATEHLIKGGYKKIAYIGGKDSLSDVDRFRGYRQALEMYGMEINDDYVQNGFFSVESGYELTKKIFEKDNQLDAVVCGNDIIALGVMQFAKENNLRVPEDFGIVGFDNIPMSSLPQINLTTVSQPRELMGNHALSLLIDEINKEDTNEVEETIKGKVFKTELIYRGTTRTVE